MRLAVHRLAALLLGLICVGLLQGCATPQQCPSRPGAGLSFPLCECKSQHDTQCRAGLFASDTGMMTRETASYPHRFLELGNLKVREHECKRMREAGGGPEKDCLERLEILSRYFNPDGQPPADKIGVALEGGGSKSAPFSLGVLAGLQQIGWLRDRVGAISSVSGGSYAASFFFQRLLDEPDNPDPPYADWFRSCVPDAFSRSQLSADVDRETCPAIRPVLPRLPDDVRCGECTRANKRAENLYDEFAKPFEYQGQVWRNPDLLFGDENAGLKRKPPGELPGTEIVQTVALFGASLVSTPFQHLSRTLFRWPYNSAPSKAAYKHGLERQFGFSPKDWHDLSALPPAARAERRLAHYRERDFPRLGEVIGKRRAPLWIVNASTPGATSVGAWLSVPARDALRHNFELTPLGYGSGIHGYAKTPPVSDLTFLGFPVLPERMTLLDGVTASAAFFDDEQSLFSQQPGRLAAGLLQHGLNVTWFTEIPNFNTGRANRLRSAVTPWPFHGLVHAANHRTTPYIHLHDGGNSENTGILPLLRRGYKRIVYAHGTMDRDAQWTSICHLKNELEMDGAYRLTSTQLDELAKGLTTQRNPRAGMRGFTSYLDQLCTLELNDTDRLVYSKGSGVSRLARLVCSRFGDTRIDRPCPEYEHAFPTDPTKRIRSDELCSFEPITDLFFRASGRGIEFKVEATALSTPADFETAFSATIHAIVPAVDWREVREQLQPASDNTREAAQTILDDDTWKGFCESGSSARAHLLQVNHCAGPDGNTLSFGPHAPSGTPGLPCTSLAFMLANACIRDKVESPCKDGQGKCVNFRALLPEFPQHDFIFQTWNSSYTLFAAYFDLGRHYTAITLDRMEKSAHAK